MGTNRNAQPDRLEDAQLTAVRKSMPRVEVPRHVEERRRRAISEAEADQVARRRPCETSRPTSGSSRMTTNPPGDSAIARLLRRCSPCSICRYCGSSTVVPNSAMPERQHHHVGDGEVAVLEQAQVDDRVLVLAAPRARSDDQRRRRRRSRSQ